MADFDDSPASAGESGCSTALKEYLEGLGAYDPEALEPAA